MRISNADKRIKGYFAMRREDMLATLQQVENQPSHLSVELLDAAANSSYLEVEAFLFDLLEDSWVRIEEAMGLEWIYAFAMRHIERCIAVNHRTDDSNSRIMADYEAGWAAANLSLYLIKRRDAESQKVKSSLANWICRLCRELQGRQREVLILGIIEHLMEDAEARRFLSRQKCPELMNIMKEISGWLDK